MAPANALVKLGRLAAANKKYNIFTSLRPLDDIKSKLTDNKTNKDKHQQQSLQNHLCAIKDNIATTAEPTTCASRILSDYYSPFNSTVVELLENQGAVVVGKTNLDEFGMGDANANSHFGQTFNPLHDKQKHLLEEELKQEHQYVPGGSSGGSAAAVSAGVCDFALGTDTGGSTRLPAAFCGIVGFKPSYGRISRWGVVPYAQSLDTVGILANDIDVVKKVFNVLDKYDVKDPTSLSNELRAKFDLIDEREGLSDHLASLHEKINVGVSKEYLAESMSENTTIAIKQITKALFNAKFSFKPFDLPLLPYSLPTYFTIAYSEAASNLARYDGVRYGYSAIEDPNDQSDDYKQYISNTRSVGFGAEVKRRILVGNYNLSSQKFRNNFLKAEAMRKELTEEFNAIFKLPNILLKHTAETAIEEDEKFGAINNDGIDFILAPVSTSQAPSLQSYAAKVDENPVNSYINDALLVPSSLAGLPSIAVPWNIAGGDGAIENADNDKIVGVQVIGQYGDDKRVLEFAKKLVSLNF